jgi:hypothetical protein
MKKTPLTNPEYLHDALSSLNIDKQRCYVNLSNTGHSNTLELIGFRETISEAETQILNKINEIVKKEAETTDGKLSDLPLYQLRILYVNRYVRRMKSKFRDFECSVSTKESCVNFKGRKSDVISHFKIHNMLI